MDVESRGFIGLACLRPYLLYSGAALDYHIGCLLVSYPRSDPAIPSAFSPLKKKEINCTLDAGCVVYLVG